MNFKRGLIRLWALFTIVWFLVAGGFVLFRVVGRATGSRRILDKSKTSQSSSLKCQSAACTAGIFRRKRSIRRDAEALYAAERAVITGTTIGAHISR